MSEQPDFIPYGRTGSGDAGNQTSIARRIEEDASGISSERRREVWRFLAGRGSKGATVGEVEDEMHLGHGQASSALTHLHRAGKVRRLTEKRRKQQVYVTPHFVLDRKESPYRPRLTMSQAEFDREVMLAQAQAWDEGYEKGKSFAAEAIVTKVIGQRPRNPYR